VQCEVAQKDWKATRGGGTIARGEVALGGTGCAGLRAGLVDKHLQGEMNMKKHALAIALLCVGVLVATAAYAASVAITQSKFKYNGIAYFRAKSENVVLASYGEKKTPVGKPNYLAVQNDVNRAKLGKVKVKISGPYTVDWGKFSASEVNASIKYLKTAGGTGSFSRDAAKSAKLQLVKFSLDEGQLKTLLNKEADGARNYLKDEGNDGRIVSEVWVATEASLAETITNCGSVSGSGSNGGFEVSISGRSCGTNTSSVTIPTNTTFAYLLHKVKKWNKGKTKVEDLEDDNKGLN